MVGILECKNSGSKNSSATTSEHVHKHTQHHGRIVAWRAVESVIDAGAALRLQDQAFFKDRADGQDASRMRILRLVRAIRRERTLGYRGHWSYNPARHLALLQALRAEKLHTFTNKNNKTSGS